MNIQEIKNHGMQLGLEAEINRRATNLKDAVAKRDWTWCHSHATWIINLADELIKLEPKQPKKVPTPNEPTTTDSTSNP